MSLVTDFIFHGDIVCSWSFSRDCLCHSTHSFFLLNLYTCIYTQFIFTMSFLLIHGCFNSFIFYKNGKLARNQTDRSGVRVKKENEKFTIVCLRSSQNLLNSLIIHQAKIKEITTMEEV